MVIIMMTMIIHLRIHINKAWKEAAKTVFIFFFFRNNAWQRHKNGHIFDAEILRTNESFIFT